MPILKCKRVVFYCENDEQCFFDFAGRIKAIRKIECVEYEIQLHVPAKLSDESLRDILGLFQRYKVQMRQLRQFETPRNREWFANKRMYWFKKVFGG